MTSRQSDFDPRYDAAFQRGGGDGGTGIQRFTAEAPHVVEISDVPAVSHPTGAPPQVWVELERRQRKYRLAAWGLAGGLVVLGLFGLFADLIIPPEPAEPQMNYSGYMNEPWTMRLRYAAPNLIMLGVITAIVQVVIEQMQAFRMRMGR